MKVIRIDGEIGFEVTASWVAEQIKGEKEIKLVINSAGGSVTEGFAIYNELQRFEGKITALIDNAMSIATLIMMAADTRQARKNSSLVMIHKPWAMTLGNSTELAKTAETLDKLESLMIGAYMQKFKGTEEELRAMLDAETYLNAEECLELGLVDEVISEKANGLHKFAIAAMKIDGLTINKDKLLAKVDEIDAEKTGIFSELDNCAKLSDIESVLRSSGLSRREAAAAVASVKRVIGEQSQNRDHRDDDAKKALKTLQSFNF